jgi:hypothetical protein
VLHRRLEAALSRKITLSARGLLCVDHNRFYCVTPATKLTCPLVAVDGSSLGFTMMRARNLFAVVVGCCLLLAGCGERTVNVSGTVALPPNITFKDDDSVQIGFEAEGGKKGVAAVGKPSGKEATFSAEIPPGSYRISVSLQAYAGHKDSGKHDAEFKDLNKSFKSADTTKLSYTVTSDPKQSIKIDLAQGSVSKN